MADRAIVLQNVVMDVRAVRQASSVFILGIAAVWAGQARASLGGDAASVLADASELHGVVQSSTLRQFEIQEIVTDNGMHVREFLNRDGIVFAVTWTGPAMPDLQRLLGAQFAVYTAALAARDHLGLHRSVRVATSGLVVESDGHLRSYVGRAYLSAMIPTDVSIADLR
jgi:Protein of unknown function (DUF2844)